MKLFCCCWVFCAWTLTLWSEPLVSVKDFRVVSAAWQPINIFITWAAHSRTCVIVSPWSHWLAVTWDCVSSVRVLSFYTQAACSGVLFFFTCQYLVISVSQFIYKWQVKHLMTCVYLGDRRPQHTLSFGLVGGIILQNLQSMRKSVEGTSVQCRKHLASFQRTKFD